MLSLRGKSVNGAGLAGRGAKGSTQEQKFDGPFHISAHVDKLALRAGVSIAPFILDTNGVEDRLQSLSLSGNYSHNGMITGSMTNEGGTRRLAISATDAGTFFKGLFGFTSIKGGELLPGLSPRISRASPNAVQHLILQAQRPIFRAKPR